MIQTTPTTIDMCTHACVRASSQTLAHMCTHYPLASAFCALVCTLDCTRVCSTSSMWVWLKLHVTCTAVHKTKLFLCNA